MRPPAQAPQSNPTPSSSVVRVTTSISLAASHFSMSGVWPAVGHMATSVTPCARAARRICPDASRWGRSSSCAALSEGRRSSGRRKTRRSAPARLAQPGGEIAPDLAVEDVVEATARGLRRRDTSPAGARPARRLPAARGAASPRHARGRERCRRRPPVRPSPRRGRRASTPVPRVSAPSSESSVASGVSVIRASEIVATTRAGPPTGARRWRAQRANTMLGIAGDRCSTCGAASGGR